MADQLFEILNPKTDWYIVLRPFDGAVKHLKGEVVNTKEWIHKNKLVDARYIAALPHGTELPSEDKDGRRFLDLEDHQKEKVERPVPKASDRKAKKTKAS